MNSQKKCIVAYHGTSNEGEKGILKSRTFNPSVNDDEWIGKGIYYFINYKAIENSINWAKNVKNFKFYSIIESNICVEENKILDLDDPEYRELFHDYREAFLKISGRKNVIIKDDDKKKVKKLDCMIIDKLAQKGNFDAILQSRYIELRKRKSGKQLIASNVPNCNILCVKNYNIIDLDSIRCIRRGKSDD